MRCKVGDLAFVVAADHPENIGRIVEVVESCSFELDAWWIRPVGSPHKTDNGYVMRALAFDRELRPIRPGSLDEETTESRELEAA